MAAQCVSRELRRQPGLLRRLELADYVRVRPQGSRGDLRIVRRRQPDRSRHPAHLPDDTAARRGLRSAEPGEPESLEWEQGRRPLARREMEPGVAVAPAAY